MRWAGWWAAAVAFSLGGEAAGTQDFLPSRCSTRLCLFDTPLRAPSLSPRLAIAGAGGGVLALDYALAVMMARTRSYDGWLMMPIVGPWVALGERGAAGNARPGELAFDILDGIGQLFGLAMVIGGIASEHAHRPRSDLTEARRPRSGVRWTIKPWAAGKPGLTIKASW